MDEITVGEVRFGDVVEVAAKDGSWKVYGEVTKVDDLGTEFYVEVGEDTARYENDDTFTVCLVHRPPPSGLRGERAAVAEEIAQAIDAVKARASGPGALEARAAYDVAIQIAHEHGRKR